MNTKQILLGLLFLIISFAKAQTIEELYDARNYKQLIKFSEKTKDLTAYELYCIGYAFFQLENDEKAIKMYNQAIEKGLDDDYIYLYKGLSLRYDKQYKKAIDNFKIAVNRNPKGQKNYTELGNCFFYQEEYDSALVYFYKARDLEYQLADPYVKIPYIFSVKEDFEQALIEYYKSAKLINQQDPEYVELLKRIGQLEGLVFHQYEKAITVYNKILLLDPRNHDVYVRLSNLYYNNKNYEKGDSIFQFMKKEYEAKNLSKNLQKYGSMPISQFEWNKQTVTIYRYFKEPKETLDIMYKIYLFSKDGQSIERTLMTEQTIQFKEDGAKHLLCESEKNGGHHTYPFGWSTDEIDYESLKKASISIFDKKLTAGASSNFSTNSDSKQSKKKRRKKKK